MTYKFKCPNCGKIVEIDMPMNSYCDTGHMCHDCGCELERDFRDIAGSIKWNTDGNFGKSK